MDNGDCFSMSFGEVKVLCGPAIWLIRPQVDFAKIEVVCGNSPHNVSLDMLNSALVFGSRVKVSTWEGACYLDVVPLQAATKLLAFLDACRKSGRLEHEPYVGMAAGGVVYVSSGLTICDFEGWLVSRVMGAECDVDPLLAFLRAQESYGLVSFLLRERTKPQLMTELASQYGVSESLFRRMSRQAFGRGLKRELRQWRAVQAVLDVVDGRDSMTSVAMNNGFASASHFSREIRDLFGVAPSKLRGRT